MTSLRSTASNNLVYVSTRLMKTSSSRTTKSKLRPKYQGPFKISEVLGPTHVRIDLPSTSKMHPVINVEHLKRCSLPPRQITRQQPIAEDVYEMEFIRSHRTKRGRLEYLIHWKGYPDYEDTWEPPANIEVTPRAKQHLREYMQREGLL